MRNIYLVVRRYRIALNCSESLPVSSILSRSWEWLSVDKTNDLAHYELAGRVPDNRFIQQEIRSMQVLMGTGDVARHFGGEVREWQVRRLFEKGCLPEPNRVANRRVICRASWWRSRRPCGRPDTSSPRPWLPDVDRGPRRRTCQQDEEEPAAWCKTDQADTPGRMSARMIRIV